MEVFQNASEVQSQVLDKELIKWKREQQLAGNGFPMQFSLETLQEWCEGLADVIWTLRQQVRQLDTLREGLVSGFKSCIFDHLQTDTFILVSREIRRVPPILIYCQDFSPKSQVSKNYFYPKRHSFKTTSFILPELLSNLVTGTFIIEKQPPQVMKTNTRFTATVRLLVGGVLNVHMAAPAVSVSIVSESQANQLLTSPSNLPKRKEDYSSGDILNGNGTMEFHSATKQVSVSFRNLQLKKIKRTEKKGTESVMDEKFSVLFWTEFQVGELKFQVGCN